MTWQVAAAAAAAAMALLAEERQQEQTLGLNFEAPVLAPFWTAAASEAAVAAEEVEAGEEGNQEETRMTMLAKPAAKAASVVLLFISVHGSISCLYLCLYLFADINESQKFISAEQYKHDMNAFICLFLFIPSISVNICQYLYICMYLLICLYLSISINICPYLCICLYL